MICPSRQEADKAVTACHNKKTLPGVSVTLISVPVPSRIINFEHYDYYCV